ncbi:MAG: cell division protein FtsZ [Bacteroidia bacterium]|nr:cell division protein FtsZ [Bacteroidia bacterium]
MQFEFPKNQHSIIKVIGVGGGGGNAVNNMFEKGIEGVDFFICNTDMQALKNSPVPNKVRLGANQTEGLGAGANPDVGRKAAMESTEEVRQALQDKTRMVFITAGMGGGTGTGAAPVLASMAKEMGILTVGIVTTPFKFEGPRRAAQAEAGIKELQSMVDTLIVIDNNNLHQILGSSVTMKKAFEEADQVLCNAARGIAEIITSEGYINVDFADVCTIMRDGGKSLMGTALGSGENRAMEAVEAAVNSPLLDNIGLEGARAIIVNITASEDSLRMDETTAIVEHVQETAGMDANIIYGIVYDESMGDNLRVTVIATRYSEVDSKATRQAAAPEVQQTPVVPTPTLVQPPVQSAPPSEPIDHSPRRVQLDETQMRKPVFERLDRREREERVKKLNSKVYDIHDPESLSGLEAMPAYMRKEVLVDPEKDRAKQRFSRLSLEEDEESRYRLKDNNSFLHDILD